MSQANQRVQRIHRFTRHAVRCSSHLIKKRHPTLPLSQTRIDDGQSR